MTRSRLWLRCWLTTVHLMTVHKKLPPVGSIRVARPWLEFPFPYECERDCCKDMSPYPATALPAVRLTPQSRSCLSWLFARRPRSRLLRWVTSCWPWGSQWHGHQQCLSITAHPCCPPSFALLTLPLVLEVMLLVF